jgi:hypothetical protein
MVKMFPTSFENRLGYTFSRRSLHVIPIILLLYCIVGLIIHAIMGSYKGSQSQLKKREAIRENIIYSVKIAGFILLGFSIALVIVSQDTRFENIVYDFIINKPGLAEKIQFEREFFSLNKFLNNECSDRYGYGEFVEMGLDKFAQDCNQSNGYQEFFNFMKDNIGVIDPK